MGCACAKPEALEEPVPSPKYKSSRQSSARYSNASSKGNHSQPLNSLLGDQQEKERRFQQHSKFHGAVGVTQIGEPFVPGTREPRPLQVENVRPRNIPKHVEGEHVAAGWPAWLSAVAGEAIRGWIPRRADSFEKLGKIGQGTYSNVYKARDLDSGKIVALKKVRFDNLEPESVRFMAREILVLRRLDHPNIIKLEGLVTSRMSCSLYLVFEYMEHDLAGLAACPGISFTEPQVKCYLHQLLSGLEHCHGRGVLHRDIKGSNLLLDNSGLLKIADFGLATFFRPDQNQPLTSRVVTLWYRPPELLLGATEYAVGVDLWSTGCILAELLAGKPIMPGRTEVEQLHKIFKLCGSPSEDYWKKSKLPHATIFKPQQPYKRCIAETFKGFPASSLLLLDKLLAIEPNDRGTASQALRSEFFSSKPYACDPSSLPQYPPSKEMDAKIRDEENKRQRNAPSKTHGDALRRVPGRDRGIIPAPETNAELNVNFQKRRVSDQSSAKSRTEKFPLPHEDSTLGFLVEHPWQGQGSAENQGSSCVPPSRNALPSGALSSKSGPMGPPAAGPRRKKFDVEDVRMAPSRPASRAPKSMTVTSQSGDLSQLSSMIASAANKSGGHRHRERSILMEVGRQGSTHRRLEQVEAAQFSESFRGSSMFRQDGRPPLRPTSLLAN